MKAIEEYKPELEGVLPAHALASVLAAYHSEGRRLVTTAQAADLIGAALRESAAHSSPAGP